MGNIHWWRMEWSRKDEIEDLEPQDVACKCYHVYQLNGSLGVFVWCVLIVTLESKNIPLC